MGKFENSFDEVQYFSNSTYVLSGNYSANEAAILFSNYTGDDIMPTQLSKDRVRFGYPPEHVEGYDELGSCWYTGAGNGKGTKAVWILDS